MSRIPFEVVEQTAQVLANTIDQVLRLKCNDGDRRWQFMLHIVQTGPGGLATYVSNCHRDDAIRMIAEWLERQRTEAFDSTDIKESCWTCGESDPVVSIIGKHRAVRVCLTCSGNAVVLDE
jgi:hypothetical protein